ncbi:hypothetical protein BJ322DRAFT_1109516 [Thelephora terrestris]|uniref:Uncharacterized protein n=1 Tax=Thelephora terrestris TaxID=56493 RepID=A0A9P6L6H9_9AGAM|nr:hypothetical protein BJ322DRAFT_1109516 [Thelephora terrestris]
MSSKQLGKKPAPTPNTGTATGASTTKSGKSKEQLEFLTSHHLGFLTHQTATTLNRFWPPVFDGWYKKWPITVTPADIKQYGSPANAILVFRKVTNEKILLKSDLKLNQNEKRKLAPAQAYCSYFWNHGLKDIVEARWKKHRESQSTVGGDSSAAATSGSSIPIDFKLKIAKEFYDALPPAEKKKVDDRRDEEWRKLYRPIRVIEDVRERDKKLAWHEVGQPSVAKTLSRMLKNLEDQAGCIAHLFVGFADPRTGDVSFQNYSQGGGEELDFRAFCGSDWDNVIEKRFMEWGMQIFGEPGTSGRKTFMFTNAPPVPDPGASSSAVSDSGFDVTEASDVLPLPQDLISFPVDGELHTTVPRASNFVSPQEIFGPGASNFVSPQEIFGNHKSVGSITEKTAIVPSAATQPLLPAPSSDLVLAHSSALLPTPSSDLVPAPVLDSCQADVDRVVLEPTPVTALPISHMTPEIPPNQRSSSPGDGSETAAAATSTYKARSKPNVTATTAPRRDSIEGAPEIILTLIGSGYELLKQPDVPSFATSSPPTSSSPTPSTTSFGEIVPSSQQSLEGFLTIPSDTSLALEHPPPSHQPLDGPSIATERSTLLASRITPSYRIDRSDIPSWLIERGRLDSVLMVEAGSLWERLIALWLRQERRLGFGLDEKIGTNLPMTNKPQILKEYFKWRHDPSKGDAVTLPEFGKEVTLWWSTIQPKWRHGGQTSPNNSNDYSYALAGGKKGVFLLILCLAWWDHSFGKNLNRTKEERRAAAAQDDAALDFSDLPTYDADWSNIVNDLIFVLELAQGWPVPTKGTPETPVVTSGQPETKRVASGRKKRAAEGTNTSRKRQKSS